MLTSKDLCIKGKEKPKMRIEGFVGHFSNFSKKKIIRLNLRITNSMEIITKKKRYKFLSQTLLCEKAKALYVQKMFTICFISRIVRANNFNH